MYGEGRTPRTEGISALLRLPLGGDWGDIDPPSVFTAVSHPCGYGGYSSFRASGLRGAPRRFSYNLCTAYSHGTNRFSRRSSMNQW